jgi:hypothetical protein
VDKPTKPRQLPLPFVKERLKVGLHDGAGETDYPLLLELLRPVYVDGLLVRLSGSIRISVDSGAYLVQIDLPTEQAEIRWRTETLANLLRSLEHAVQDNTVTYVEGWKKQKRDRQRASDSLD